MLTRRSTTIWLLTLAAICFAGTGQASPYDSSPLADYRSPEAPLPAPTNGRFIGQTRQVSWAEPQPMPLPSNATPRYPAAPGSSYETTSSTHSISLIGHMCGACGSRGCQPQGCATCDTGCEPTCHVPVWAHRSGVFGEWLVLRARNADVAYAVPIDGGLTPPILPPPVQRGPVSVADPEFDSAYRVGGTMAFDLQSSVTVSYTRFESNTVDTASASAPLALRALVLHPQTANATADFLDATANLGLEFKLGDLDYRAVLYSNSCSAINYGIGVRYARLDQNFEGVFTNGGTTELLSTGIDFEGVGLRLGLDGERHVGSKGVFFYGRGTVNFLGGESSGYYTQATSPAAPTVNTTWSAARMVTILELELGAGWQSCCGRYRFSGGYRLDSWQGLVTADKFIEGVRSNDFVDMNDTISFDGLNAKVEYRW